MRSSKSDAQDDPVPAASAGVSPPEPKHEAVVTTGAAQAPVARGLRETIHLDQWLSALVVVTTCLALLLAIGVAIRLLASIGHTLLLFTLGGLVAYALGPLVEGARRRPGGKIGPRWQGVLAVFALMFAVIVVAVALLSEQMSNQVRFLIRDHARIEAHAREELNDFDRRLAMRNIHINLPDLIDHPPPAVKSWGEAVTHGTLDALRHLSTDVVESVIVLLIALYFLIFSAEMREGANRALPDHVRPYVIQWQSDVSRILGGFVRGQLTLALITGAVAAAGCALLGLRLWLLIGLFVTVVALIPVFGPYIGAIPAIIAAALAPPGHFLPPTVRVIAVVVLFIVLNEAGSKILYPRLVGQALGLHEVVVLFVLFAGLEIGGLWGVLFAAPLTALAITTAVQIYCLWHGEPPYSIVQAAHTEGASAEAEGGP